MHTKGELPVQGALPKQQHPREGQVFSWLAGYCAVRGLSYGITGNKHVSPKGFAGVSGNAIKQPEIILLSGDSSLFTDNRSSLQQEEQDKKLD